MEKVLDIHTKMAIVSSLASLYFYEQCTLNYFSSIFFFSEQLKTFSFKSISPLIFHVKSIFVHYNKTEIVGLILSLRKKKFLPVSEHFLPRTFCILSQT